jgi:hypothetical protein
LAAFKNHQFVETLGGSGMTTPRSRSSISFFVPEEKFMLEEANLSAELIDQIAGKSVLVETCPEEPPATRRVEPDDFPLLIDPNGNCWNEARRIGAVRLEPTSAKSQYWG